MPRIIRLSAFWLTVVLAGCAVSQPDLKPVRPAARPMRQASAGNIRQKCVQLKKVLSSLEVRGIGMTPRAFVNGYTPEEICRFIAGCGFNRVYFNISSPAELDGKLTAFLKGVKAEGMTAEIVLRQDDLRDDYRGSSLVRSWQAPAEKIAGVIQKISIFNASLPEEAAKIGGIVFAVSPHKFVSDTRGSTGQIFAWSPKSFGPGLDNDLLMKQTLQTLQKLPVKNMKLTAAFPDFYHELAGEGKLTCGKVKDFAAVRPGEKELILLSTGNKPTQIVAGSGSEMRSVPAGKKIILGLEIAGHTSVSAEKLRRRDWKDLVSILSYVIKEHKKYPEFSGIMLAPLSVLNHLIMEQD